MPDPTATVTPLQIAMGVVFASQAAAQFPVNADFQMIAYRRAVARGALPVVENPALPVGEAVTIAALSDYFRFGAADRETRQRLGLPAESFLPIVPLGAGGFDPTRLVHVADTLVAGLREIVSNDVLAPDILLAAAKLGDPRGDLLNVPSNQVALAKLSPEAEARAAALIRQPVAAGGVPLPGAGLWANAAEVYLALRLEQLEAFEAQQWAQQNRQFATTGGLDSLYYSPESYKAITNAALAAMGRTPGRVTTTVTVPSGDPKPGTGVWNGREWVTPSIDPGRPVTLALADAQILKLSGTSGSRLAALAF